MANEMLKIGRHFLEWQWYDDNNTKVLFLHLLLTASTEATEWHGVSVARGQRITTLAQLVEETGLTIQCIRTSLRRLQSSGEVLSEVTNKYRVVTVCKFDDYYGGQKGTLTNNQQSTNKQTNKQANKQNAFVNPCNSDNCENENESANKQTNKQANKQKEERKQERVSPYNPLPKEENKEESFSLSSKSTKDCLPIARAREVFENFFRSTFGADYYWNAKDAASMKKLLQKITYARRSRNLPNDEKQVLDALAAFLAAIHDEWILNNFSVSVINSKYNEIVSQAKNNGNGTSRSISAADAARYARQQDVANLIAELRAQDAARGCGEVR